jgi:hypothetical protein
VRQLETLPAGSQLGAPPGEAHRYGVHLAQLGVSVAPTAVELAALVTERCNPILQSASEADRLSPMKDAFHDFEPRLDDLSAS